MEFYDFPFSNFIIPTDKLTPSFFRGVGLNHQPDIEEYQIININRNHGTSCVGPCVFL
jgi:hypothetical protein